MTSVKKISIPADLYSYTWRAADLADAPAIHAMLLACDQANETDDAGTVETIRRELKDTWLQNRETDTLLAVTAGGGIAAIGFVFANPRPVIEHQAYLWEAVHPEHRDQDLRTFLLKWMEERGLELLPPNETNLPRVLRLGCEEKMASRIKLYGNHGFTPVRYWFRMRRDLGKPIPERPLPEGISLHNFTWEQDPALMAAFNEAFKDHWKFDPATEEDWKLWVTGRDDFRADLSFLAMDGDEIAGFSINGVNPEENQRKEINEGRIRELGTRHPWRKRGIATALLCASMRAFQADGLDYATLSVDTQNQTGALGLYERLGFEPVRRYVTFEKTLD